MKKVGYLLAMAASLIIGGITALTPVSAETVTEKKDFDCAVVAEARTPDDQLNVGCVAYGSEKVIWYTEAEAAAADLPEGYTDSVVSVIRESDTSKGVVFDFASQKIPQGLVESITIRFYVGSDETTNDDYPEMRIASPQEVHSKWILRKSVKDKTEQWLEFTISEEKELDANTFERLFTDGYLNRFEFSVRNKTTYAPFYIDNVKVNLKENDGVAPVIAYNGSDTVTVSEGAEFVLEATAFDEQENRNIELQYDWAENTQFFEDGTLKTGTWTLKIVAEDYYGNKAEQTISVNVLEADKTAPVITTSPKEMYLQVGTVMLLEPKATDNSGNVTVTSQWSSGALDEDGALTEGDHTFTITATDPSGNVTTHTIRVIVAVDETFGDTVINEETEFLKVLTAAKTETIESLDLEYLKYAASDYSEENYATITEAYNLAKSSIDNERNLERLNEHIEAFISAASSIEKKPKTETGDSFESTSSEETNSSDKNKEDAPTIQNSAEEKKGCGSSILGVGMTSLLLISVAMLFSKKRKE